MKQLLAYTINRIKTQKHYSKSIANTIPRLKEITEPGVSKNHILKSK